MQHQVGPIIPSRCVDGSQLRLYRQRFGIAQESARCQMIHTIRLKRPHRRAETHAATAEVSGVVDRLVVHVVYTRSVPYALNGLESEPSGLVGSRSTVPVNSSTARLSPMTFTEAAGPNTARYRSNWVATAGDSATL